MRPDLGHSELERPWISGPTSVDVGAASASWRADWTVAMNGFGRSLRLIFSPGLQPVDVEGPDVESTELIQADGHPEMTVRFRADVRGRTTVAARGVADVNADRPWSLPAAWPADGEWLGGPVSVRLDRGRELQACTVIQGRRLPVSAEDAAARIALRFEPERPGPYAEVVFLGAGAQTRAKVRGWARYARSRSDLVADVTWIFPANPPGDLRCELPAGWSVERILAGDAPVAWQYEPSGPGSMHVRLTGPTVGPDARSYTARIHATRAANEADSGVVLPRISGLDGPTESVWIATATGGRYLAPATQEGVAWLNPGVFDDAGLAALIGPKELSRALAWRPVGVREQVKANLTSPMREIRSVASGTLVIAAGRVHEKWSLTIRPGSTPLTAIPVAWSAADSTPPRWTLRRAGGGQVLLAERPLTMAEKSSLGLDQSIRGAALELPESTSSTLSLECFAERAWPGRAAVPLLQLPQEYGLRATLAVRLGPGLIGRSEIEGLKAVERLAGDTTPAEALGPRLRRPDSTGSAPRISRHRRKALDRHGVVTRCRNRSRYICDAGHRNRRRWHEGP